MDKQFDQELYLGAVYDAMYDLCYHASDFYIDLKPKAGYTSFFSGPAFTTRGRKAHIVEDFRALDLLKYAIYNPKHFLNSPVVLLQAGDDICAHFGDINALIYQKLGALGFITDGNIRDVAIIDSYRFPAFCNNITPIDSANHWILTDFNIPIVLKGVEIAPEDWIFASNEGVIRVRKKDKPKFYEKLKLILAKEKELRDFISNFKNLESLSSMLKEHTIKNGRW